MSVKVGGNTGIVPPHVQNRLGQQSTSGNTGIVPPHIQEKVAEVNARTAKPATAQAASEHANLPDFSPAAQMRAFKKSGYTADDAKTAMKSFDFLRDGSVDDAKRYIGLKVINKSEGMLQAAGITRAPFDDHELTAAFKRSGYTTEDAKAAMRKFDFLKDGTLDEAKKYIGLKVVNRYEGMLEEVGITRAPFDPHEEMAAFKRSGYSEDDAKAAMKKFDFLKDGTLDEAKRYLGLKVLNKYESMLEEAGITPAPFDDHELMGAFKRSGYSRADAEQAMKKFDFLKDGTVQEAMKYLGLKKVNGYEEMLTAAGITESKLDSHDLLAAFDKGGYTTQNAHEAIKKFDFLKGSTVKEAKEYIGLKVVNRYEEMLRDVGIVPSNFGC